MTATSSKKLYKFCGKVFKHPAFVALCKQYPEYELYFKAFSDYWRMGPINVFGKDVLFTDPNEAIRDHLRHVHVNMGKYLPPIGLKNTYTWRKECWNEWSEMLAANDSPEGDPIRRHYQIPTSNAFIVYSVNEHRDAIVYDLIPENAHEEIKKPELISFYLQEIFRFTLNKNINPFPTDADLHDDRWLLINQPPIV